MRFYFFEKWIESFIFIIYNYIINLKGNIIMKELLTIKKQLKISLPIAFENFINILMTLIDTLVVTTLGTSQLGAMGAMGVVLDMMQMSIQAINVSNIALLSKARGENNEKHLKIITGNSILLTIGISLSTIFLVYLIKSISPILFNVDKICITYITIRLIGFLQSSIVMILTGHQRTIGKQGLIMILRIIAVIFNLIFDILVVKLNYGVAGVAWVTIIIDTILCAYLIIKSKDSIKYQFDKTIIKQLFNLFKWNCFERIVSRIDTFIFNILVSRIGPLKYAVHVIVIQIRNVSQAFIQGFSDGITISIGIETGHQNKEKMQCAKNVIKKLINLFSILVPVLTMIVASIIGHISFKENHLLTIFYTVLPLLIIGQYEEISGTYYFGILRGMREFRFLAQRNFITSTIKIVVATALSFTVLGITGVWIAYAVYCMAQKYLSKRKFKMIENLSQENQ